ncbi:hypothetical protein H072_9884 [Dactylellina haptotyla CBS 200.50]|uniref:Uncharacterized protein n=1 Tax=Dactylellina haptotyla (strain CBS 200.50) TaxID=1284197 RepID=S8BBQ5_DACHA|nr:hypothetical protein H072_9884 [Dactylellina haptotyla CBS 200.50]
MLPNQSSGSIPVPKSNSLTSLAASLAEIPIRKPPTKYTQRPSRLTKTHPAKVTVSTRSIPVSSVEELPKSRILPTVRNISIFSTLGAGCIIACIALVLLKHVSFWVTLAASFCGVLGAALFIEVALLVSARFRCRILDEECTIADMVQSKEDRVRKGLSWDLRGIGKKDDNKENEKSEVVTSAERRNSSANQSTQGGCSPMTSVTEKINMTGPEEIDDRDITIGVAIQRPAPIATSLPVNRV